MESNTIPSELSMIINQYMSDIFSLKKKQIKIISLISTEPFIDTFETKLKFWDINWKHDIYADYENYFLGRFHLRRDLLVNKLNNHFLAFQSGPLLFFITGGNKSFIDSGILYFVKRLYPSVIISYITSNEIYDLLQYFCNYTKQELYYRRAVRKRMFGEKHTDVSYRTENEKTHNVKYLEAFRRASNLGQWIDKINVFSEDNSYDFDISRDGIIKIRKGLFEDYYHLLNKIGEKYIFKLNNFKNRSRSLLPRNVTKPLLLPLEQDIFNDPNIRSQFINVIKAYPNCYYSIVYNGNPHIHVNVVDKLDNSSFSVRTYSTNSIIIGPQIKTSEASLMRFTKHLLDTFRETQYENI